MDFVLDLDLPVFDAFFESAKRNEARQSLELAIANRIALNGDKEAWDGLFSRYQDIIGEETEAKDDRARFMKDFGSGF